MALPSGGILSTRGLQSLGLLGLGTVGGFERLHYLLERAWDGPDLSLVFLKVCPVIAEQHALCRQT